MAEGFVTWLWNFASKYPALAKAADVLIKVSVLAGLGAAARRLTTKDLPAGRDPQREITVRSAVAYQNIIYGRCAVGGVTVYNNAVRTIGTVANTMFHVVTYAGHVVDGFEQLYLDDRVVDFTVDSVVWDQYSPWASDNRGIVETGQFRGNSLWPNPPTFIRWYNGDQTSADYELNRDVPEWSTDHIGAGQAYAVLRVNQEPLGRNDFESTAKAFENGFPRKIMAVIRGKKLYDPRSDSPGTHRVDSADTWEWSQNPALQVADYIRDTSLGMADSYSNIYWPAVHSVAEYCDATVYTPSGTQARFTGNGVINTGESHADNLKALLSSFNGRLTWIGSGWYLTAGWDAPSKTINEHMLVGDVEAAGGLDKRDTYNHVRGWFYNADEQYKQEAYATVTAAEYIARDSSEFLYRDVGLPMTTDWWEAQRVAFGILDQGDNQRIVKMPLDYSGFDLMVGKTATIDLDVFSWNNKAFRMTDWSFDPVEGIMLTAREDFQASYTDPSTTDYASVTSPALVTVNSLDVPVISSVSLVAGESRITLRWINPSARAFEWVDIYTSQTNVLSNAVLLDTVRDQQYVHSIRPRERWYYWFQTRDFAGNVSSFYPNTSASSFSTTALFPSPPDPEHIFTEEFEYQDVDSFLENWETNGVYGDITFPESGEFGGRVINVDSQQCWFVSKKRIPYDPDYLYKMEAKVKVTRRATLGSGIGGPAGSGQVVYFGTTNYRADPSTPIGTTSGSTLGNAHSFVRFNHNTSGDTLNMWYKYTGYMKGYAAWPNSGSVNANVSEDPNQHAKAHPLTRYISPHFYLNYNAGDGEMSVDYIKMQKIADQGGGLVYDPHLGHYEGWFKYTNANCINDFYLSPQSYTTFGWATDPADSLYPNQGAPGPVAIDGEYNTWNMDRLITTAGHYMVEKPRPGFHYTMPDSVAVRWQARVWVSSYEFATSSSYAGIEVIAPMAVFYTRENSCAAYIVGKADKNEGIKFIDWAVGWPAPSSYHYEKISSYTDRWIDIGGTMELSIDDLPDDNTFDPPYYVAFGLYWRGKFILTDSGTSTTSDYVYQYVTYINYWLDNPGSKISKISEESTGRYLDESDSAKTLRLASGAHIFTIPSEDDVAFADGTLIYFNLDTGSLRVTPDTGVSLYKPGDGSSSNRHITTTKGHATLQKISSGNWEIWGDID